MHIKELYKKYLEGTLSEDELLSFKNSISNLTDDGVWELISNEESVDMHFIGMSEDQKKDIFKTIDIKIKRRQKKAMVFKYVAGVACFLFLLIGFYFYSIPTERESYMTEVVSPIGKRMEVVMADGSKIFMNSGSSIYYNIENQGKREVIIKSGEVFFDITKDPKHPFKVSVDDVQIKVIGTTFNVSSCENTIHTSLFTGSIELATGKYLKKKYRLKPGDKSIYNNQDKQILITKNNYIDKSWVDGYLTFDSLPLSQVIRKIENWYGVEIVYENQKYANDLLTGSYYREPLDVVLKSICRQYDIEYRMENQVIILY